MGWKAETDKKGAIVQYRDSSTGEVVTLLQYQQSMQICRQSHSFLDATSIAILLPTLVLIALVIVAAHRKGLFPWQITAQIKRTKID